MHKFAISFVRLIKLPNGGTIRSDIRVRYLLKIPNLQFGRNEAIRGHKFSANRNFSVLTNKNNRV